MNRMRERNVGLESWKFKEYGVHEYELLRSAAGSIVDCWPSCCSSGTTSALVLRPHIPRRAPPSQWLSTNGGSFCRLIPAGFRIFFSGPALAWELPLAWPDLSWKFQSETSYPFLLPSLSLSIGVVYRIFHLLLLSLSQNLLYF